MMNAAVLSVVHTTPRLDRAAGGTSHAVAQLCDSLTEAGAQVTLLHLSRGDSTLVQPRFTPTQGSDSRRLNSRSLWASGYHRLLTDMVRERRVRVLHDHGLWEPSHAQTWSAARRSGVPLVLSPHGMLEPWALAHRRWRKQLALALYQRLILRSAAMLCVASEQELASVRRAGLRQPVAVIPNGVDIPSLPATHAGHATVRTALFIGRLHPVKGLAPLIEAWAQLRPDGWRLLIAGPDEDGHRAALEQLVAQRGLARQISFIGPVDEPCKSALLRSADLFVLPSRSENFGIAIAEALAHGLPVLTTTGTPWQILEYLGAGWRVGLEPPELTEGLRTALASSSVQRAAMGSVGRHYAAHHLGWANIAKLTLAAYAWVLGDGTQRPRHVHVD